MYPLAFGASGPKNIYLSHKIYDTAYKQQLPDVRWLLKDAIQMTYE